MSSHWSCESAPPPCGRAQGTRRLLPRTLCALLRVEGLPLMQRHVDTRRADVGPPCRREGCECGTNRCCFEGGPGYAEGLPRLGGVAAAGKGLPMTQGVGSLWAASLLRCACVLSHSSGCLLHPAFCACLPAGRRPCCRHSLLCCACCPLLCVLLRRAQQGGLAAHFVCSCCETRVPYVHSTCCVPLFSCPTQLDVPLVSRRPHFALCLYWQMHAVHAYHSCRAVLVSPLHCLLAAAERKRKRLMTGVIACCVHLRAAAVTCA